jgi:16S rRNA (guanine527-N7)-methyltransferase
VKFSVADLVERYRLSPAAAVALCRVVDRVAGDPDAPTTVTDPGAIIRDHLADSLIALDVAPVREARVVADLGAGAGFPGLPLAIALPDAAVHLVESNGRKCAFIADTAEACEIANAEAINTRAEDWAPGVGTCDLVTARAVAPLAIVAEYAAPLLRLGGTLVVWRGRRDPDEESAGARAAVELGLDPLAPLHVEPYPGALHRHLHPMVKIAATPPRFPRRAGMARKRPLGADRAAV